MIFAARGLLVSLAFFAMLYAPLSLLAVLAWRGTKRMSRKALSSANLLFALRILPFAISTAVTVFFTFPSFWLLERASLDEDAATFILALCSLVIVGGGLFRVLRAQAKTTRTVAQWMKGATVLSSDVRMPKLSASSGAPPLVLVGIRRPRVMVSETAAAMLSDDELQVAVRHELGHLRSWDNLKKFLISATPFPGMINLDRAWREAAELAADDSAVTNRQEALDLAAALIKLSRSSQLSPEPAFATGLVSGSSSTSVRVERLLRWSIPSRHIRHGWAWAFLLLLTMTAAIVDNYGITLVLTHRLTELLVP